jgi:phosphoribosylanthranilate isomerase
MIVKICGVKTKDDLDAAVEAGADAVGFLVGQIHASSDFILPGTATRLAELLPPYISPVIVTHFVESEPILEILRKTQIFNVQIHGKCSLETLIVIRENIPSTGKIIFAGHFINGELTPDCEPYMPYINAVLLDSCDRSSGRIGGTGKTHDWTKSAEYVRKNKIPVILAGGLNPENVAAAVKQVRPFGVDANSGLKNKDGNCSRELCSAFVKSAKIAFFEIKQHGESSDEI